MKPLLRSGISRRQIFQLRKIIQLTWTKIFLLFDLEFFLGSTTTASSRYAGRLHSDFPVTAQKLTLSIKDFFNQYDQICSADLVIFTEEILYGKLHFLCSELWVRAQIIVTKSLDFVVRGTIKNASITMIRCWYFSSTIKIFCLYLLATSMQVNKILQVFWACNCIKNKDSSRSVFWWILQNFLVCNFIEN